MRARYVPSSAKAVDRVHEWDTHYNGGFAAKSNCGGLTVMTDRLRQTDDAVTCKVCKGKEGDDESKG